MRYTTIVSVLLVLAFVLPAIGALAEDSCKVLIVVPSGRVNDGKTANIEVHAFDSGQYVDPSAIQAFDYDSKEISLTKKTTGQWTGSVIAADDYLSGNIEVGSKSDETNIYMRVNLEETVAPYSIEMEPKDPNQMATVKPGDSIGFKIKVFRQGQPFDDTSLEVRAIQDGQDWDTAQKLATTKILTGAYETTFTVPQVSSSTEFEVMAQIQTSSWSWISTSETVVVNFYQVWFHKQTITTTTATFDIYVAELTGKAVPGAIVWMNYSYTQTDNWMTQHENAGQATTDNTGKASYTITYTKVDHDVELEGQVLASGKTQDFGGNVVITPFQQTTTAQPPPANPFNFDVVYQDSPATVLKPGKSVTLPFIAYYGSIWPYVPSAPLNAKDIYYYAYTYEKVVSFGKVTTTSNGSFSLTVNVPNTQEMYDFLLIDFEGDMTTNNWRSDTESFVVSEYSPLEYMENPEKLKDSSIQVSVDKLRVGGTSKVTGKYSKSTSTTEGMVVWVPGKVDIKDIVEWSDTQPEWEQLSGDMGSPMSKSGDSYAASIVVPEFMPKGTYTIFVVIMVPEDMTESDPYRGIHVNYLQVKAGEGGTVGGDTGILGLGYVAGIDLGVILVLVIVIVVVVAVVAVAMMKAKKPAQPMAPQTHPAPQHGQVMVAQPVQPAAPPPQPAPPPPHAPAPVPQPSPYDAYSPPPPPPQ